VFKIGARISHWMVQLLDVDAVVAIMSPTSTRQPLRTHTTTSGGEQRGLADETLSVREHNLPELQSQRNSSWLRDIQGQK